MSYPNGRRKRRYFFSRDRSECVAWLAEKRLQKARGMVEQGDDITLMDWLQVWLERYTPNISTSTRTSYQGYVDNHVSASKIALLPLSKITTDELQRYAISLGKSG